MNGKEIDDLISDADDNESREMLRPVWVLWLTVNVLMFNLFAMINHGGVSSLTNFLIFNAFIISAMVLIYRKKLFPVIKVKNPR
ncbi:TPA: hypothetical protein I7721_19760 [Vibrio vulnificus]|nr:hypothetical protein [Vibrio vulnificus]